MSLYDLSVRITGDSSGLQRSIGEAENSINELDRAAEQLDSTLDEAGRSAAEAFSETAISAVVKLAIAKESTEALLSCLKEYADYESAIMRTSDIFGESSDAITDFAENTAGALGMAESSAYKYAATYGNLFKSITADTEQNANVTLAMLSASATIASKTGRTIDDVTERIRSGLLGNTEAIEDLGIFVNVAMLETTEAFNKMADGRSWEQLEYYEQQQIRTLAILEQANTQFGTGVAQNTATSISTLSGAFADLRVSTGQLASGALVPLISVLTGLIQGVNSTIQWVNALNGTSKTYLGIAAALAFGIPAVTLATKGLALAQTAVHAIQALLIPQTLTFGAVLKSVFGWVSLLALALGALYAIFGDNGIEEPSSDMGDYSNALKNTQINADNASKSISSVKDSANKLSKEIKRVLAGFDELNVLRADGTADSTSLIGIDTSEIDAATAALSAFEDLEYDLEFDSNAGSLSGSVKGIFQKMWVNIKKGFADWNRFWQKSGENMYIGIHEGDWEPLLTQWDGVVRKIFGDDWADFWQDAGINMNTGIKDGDWEPLLTQFDDWMRDKFGDRWSDFWTTRGEKMYEAFEYAKNDINPVFAAIYAGAEFVFGSDWTTFWEEVGADIYDAFNGNSDEVYTALSDLNNKIRSLFGESWTDFWEGVGEAIYDAFHGYDNEEPAAVKILKNDDNPELTKAFTPTAKDSWSTPGAGFDFPEPPDTNQRGLLTSIADTFTLNLPMAARGAIVTEPTALIAGDAGAEALVPLENNTGWMDRIADRINASIQQTGVSGDIHVHAELDGREVGRFCIRAVELNKAYGGG